KAGEVEHGGAPALQMRRHRHQRAERDDAGAADAGDQEIVGPIERGQVWSGQRGRACQRLARRALLVPPSRAVERDKTRAEAVDAGKILVASRQIDLALAPERRLLRLDAEAVRLDGAIAAAFADEIVDEGEFGWIDDLPALAPPPSLGGALLLVDEYGDAGYLAQLALHGIEAFAR